MGYTKAQLEEKWHEAKARVAELEEQLKFAIAAKDSANEDANDVRAREKALKEELAEKDAIIEELRKNAPKKTVRDLIDEARESDIKSVISTDAIIDTALKESDIPDDCDPKLRAFLLKCIPDSPQRNYFDLNSDDEDDEDDDDDEDDEDDDDDVEAGSIDAPYGRSASGEYLDPDEAE